MQIHFNPRARVGRDQDGADQDARADDFNPRARVGRDTPFGRRIGCSCHFNPRARVGRDNYVHKLPCIVPHFNPRARVGRDCACLHGLNYSGRAIFFANLILSVLLQAFFAAKSSV